MINNLSIVVLAAGQGTRMKSDLPKVLHPMGGRPLLSHVIDVAQQLVPDRIDVVYGHGGEKVKSAVNDPGVQWAFQEKQLGTGHAVMQAIPKLDPETTVLVVYGDVPLIRKETLERLLLDFQHQTLVILTVELEDPTGYGRIIRGQDNSVQRIVEEKDATAEQRKLKEVNTGIIAARSRDLQRWLSQVGSNNTQGEYYLTDCIEITVNEGSSVHAVLCQDADEILGINDKCQLARCERIFQSRMAQRLMRAGVTLSDPDRLDIRGKVSVGRDICIDVNVILEGEVQIGDAVSIGANCIVKDTNIGAGTDIKPNSIVEQALIGERCQIGPFTRVRPETRLENEVRLGNFVEVKKSTIAKQSKVNHLSYIGDTDMGERVNVGAGTITCNYDGANKHLTQIGDDVFVGSDTQLIAPVKVGNGATIGAGSTINKDVPGHKLVLSRARQVSIEGWQRPRKIKE